MKKIISLVILFLFVSGAILGVLGACSDSGGIQETTKLRKAIFNGDKTIETSMNGIAGKDGAVSYYMPKDQPTNQNFRRLGVKIEKDGIIADYTIMVDTSANSSLPDMLIFGGKYKFVFNKKGNGKDGKDEFIAFLLWGGMRDDITDELSARITYSNIKPEFSTIK